MENTSTRKGELQAMRGMVCVRRCVIHGEKRDAKISVRRLISVADLMAMARRLELLESRGELLRVRGDLSIVVNE